MKPTNFFPKHILTLKAHDLSILAKKKLFCHVTVNGYLCNFLCKFLIKMEALGGAKSKNRHPIWLYCTVVGLSEAATGSVLFKKLFLKISQDPQKSLFKKLQLYYKETTTQVFPVDVAKFLRLPISKNICERLLLDCFNGSLLHRPECSRSILYDSVRLNGPSHRSSLSRHLWFWTES